LYYFRIIGLEHCKKAVQLNFTQQCEPQFYKCWRKQRLKIEEKERRDFDAIIIYFSAGTGKKDRSKLFT